MSRDILVRDLIVHKGDVHHVFPKNYLKSSGLSQSRYNQIANYVMMQTEINIAIKNKPPFEYFNEVMEQCVGGNGKYGGIKDLDQLRENFKMNCIPNGMEAMDINDYEGFLHSRRGLMAGKIRDFYGRL